MYVYVQIVYFNFFKKDGMSKMSCEYLSNCYVMKLEN